MCKIVPRYALHHRVASSPPALFLPLAFFRYLLSPLYSPSFCRACFFWLLSILAALLAFFFFLFPLISFVSFFLITLYLFFYVFLPAYIFLTSFSCVPYISRSFYFPLLFLSHLSFPSDLFISCQLSFTSPSHSIYVLFFRFLSSFRLSIGFP